jgi:RNase H-fold protein (predicted Holliday junction resolvase)
VTAGEAVAARLVLGIDPGTRKCGLAVVAPGEAPVHLEIVPLGELAARLAAVIAAYPIAVAAVGRGTNAGPVIRAARELGLVVAQVDERETTLLARARYFRDHPPRGWRRLIPRGMLLPERPIDDYAALLIAERYLAHAAPREEAG